MPIKKREQKYPLGVIGFFSQAIIGVISLVSLFVRGLMNEYDSNYTYLLFERATFISLCFVLLSFSVSSVFYINQVESSLKSSVIQNSVTIEQNTFQINYLLSKGECVSLGPDGNLGWPCDSLNALNKDLLSKNTLDNQNVFLAQKSRKSYLDLSNSLFLALFLLILSWFVEWITKKYFVWDKYWLFRVFSKACNFIAVVIIFWELIALYLYINLGYFISFGL